MTYLSKASVAVSYRSLNIKHEDMRGVGTLWTAILMIKLIKKAFLLRRWKYLHTEKKKYLY